MWMTSLYWAQYVYTVYIQSPVSAGGILAAFTTNILLYFYIYNFNLIFNLIQRSELNCQFAKNV